LSFCPECGHPTAYATGEEERAWDLAQWRAHRDGASKAATLPAPAVIRKAAPRRAKAERDAAAPSPVTEVNGATPSRRKAHLPADRARTRMARPRLKPFFAKLAARVRVTENGHRVIHLDGDNPFAYTACPTCARTDWTLRTGRNDDATWGYWCVRCSRSFKTEYRLAHGPKPFVTALVIVATLVALTYLL
jgi:hypothetical protein